MSKIHVAPIRLNPRKGRFTENDGSVLIGGEKADVSDDSTVSVPESVQERYTSSRKRTKGGTKTGRKRDERIRFTATKRVKKILDSVKEDWDTSTYINQAVFHFHTRFTERE